jgi:hypothetical protein
MPESEDEKEVLSSAAAKVDALRATGLRGLGVITQARQAGLEREHARLLRVMGAEHPRARALAFRIEEGVSRLRDIQVEIARAEMVAPKAGAAEWVLHGHVRWKDLSPAPGLTVALVDAQGQWVRTPGFACTDAAGYFLLRGTRGTAKASGREAASAAPKQESSVYLQITNREGILLYADPQSVPLTLGRVDYREIILDGETCAPPPEPTPVKETRYLGNSATREIHDLEKVKKNCQTDEILLEHRVYFRSQEEALKAGYDYCAYCFPKGRSKR